MFDVSFGLAVIALVVSVILCGVAIFHILDLRELREQLNECHHRWMECDFITSCLINRASQRLDALEKLHQPTPVVDADQDYYGGMTVATLMRNLRSRRGRYEADNNRVSQDWIDNLIDDIETIAADIQATNKQKEG